jgi:hypothetical protein
MHMNKEETKGLFLLVKGNYPNAYRDIDEVQLKIMINSWHSFFEDIPVVVMVKVVQKHILKSVYPPSIKELREEALKMVSPTKVDAPEVAWEKAITTVRKFGRYNKEKGYESLSPSIQRAIRAIGWDRIGDCNDENLGFLQNEFMKLYVEIDPATRDEYLLPKGMLQKINQISNQKQIEQSNEMP